MPNTKQQAKRAITDQKRGAVNKAKRTQLKTAVKAVKNAVNENNYEAAVEKLNTANKLLDASITSNLNHKNKVNRTKSRLTKAVNAIKE